MIIAPRLLLILISRPSSTKNAPALPQSLNLQEGDLTQLYYACFITENKLNGTPLGLKKQSEKVLVRLTITIHSRFLFKQRIHSFQTIS